MSVNKVILLGNIGQVGELREFQGGGCLIQASLATNKRGFKTKDGKEIKEQTEWHNLVFYNSLAKTYSKYVSKGDKLYIEGELKTRSWQNEIGVKQYVTEIVVMKMEMLGSNKGTHQAPPPIEEDYAASGDFPL